MKKLILIFVGLISSAGVWAGNISGQTSVCPVVPSAYGTVSPYVYQAGMVSSGFCLPIGTSSTNFEWTIVGGVFAIGANYVTSESGLGKYVMPTVYWTHTTGTHSITVKVTAPTSGGMGCGTVIEIQTLSVSFVIPAVIPPSPSSLSVSSVKMCPGSSLTLTASWSSSNPDPNADAVANNNIVYFFEVSTNGMGGPFTPANSSYSTSNTITVTLPQSSSMATNIVWRVFVKYSPSYSCWGNGTGSTINSSAPTYSTLQPLLPLPPVPILGVCLDGANAMLYLKGVSGTSLSSNYAINVQNAGMVASLNINEVITAISNYSSVAYDFYYDASNPLDGCKVSGMTPADNDHTLIVTAVANCTAGLTVTNVSNGDGSYIYSVNSGYQGSQIFSNLTPGMNTLTARDFHGCVGTTSVETFAALAFQAPGLSPDCPGNAINNGRITVNPSGGKLPYTYSIDGGGYQTSNVFPLLADGTHVISLKDSNGSGCTSSTTATVTNSPLISINSTTPLSPTCFGNTNGSITVNATGGLNTLTYSTDGSNFQTSSVLGTLPGGNYTVTVQDENQCRVSSGNVPLINPPALSFTSLTPTSQSCSEIVDGAISIVGTGGTGARRYSIDNVNFVNEGAPTVFNNLVSKSYTVYVKDANNCTTNSSLLVGLKPLISGSFLESPSISCVGKTDGGLNLTPSGGTGPYTFSWAHGALTEDVSGLKTGTYTVTIRDSKTCQQAVSYLLKDPFPINITSNVSVFNGFNVSCFGSNNGWIDLTLSGGTGSLSSVWSTGSTQPDLSALTAGHYEVEVKDSKLCSAKKSFDLVAPVAVGVSLAEGKNISCFGANDGSITLTPTGGTSSYQYSLNGTTWQPSTVFTGLPPAAYTARLRDSNGCTATVVHTITTPSAIQLSSVDKNTVCGQSNGSSVVSVTGGIPDYTYKWYTSGNALLGSSPSIDKLSSGIYRVDVVDQNNCLKQKTVTISSSNGPVISTVSVTPVTCFESTDGSSTIQITQGQLPYVIRWTDGSTTLQKNGLSRGDHIVEVSDAGNCNVFHTVTIPSPEPLAIQAISKQDPNCFGVSDGAISVSGNGGNGGNSYAWSTGSTSSSVSGLKAGTYSVEVVDSKFCKRSIDFVLTDPAPFVIDLGADKEMCEGQAMRLGIDNLLNMKYDWYSKGSVIGNDQYITVNKPGTYSLKATNEKGCEATDAIELILNPDLLKTDFLMALKAYAGDSIALIDISWPLPTSISWEFDPSATVVYSTQDLAVVSIEEPGLYTFGMTSHLGGCSGQRLQAIEIIERPKKQEGGRVGTFSLVNDVTVYPNPSEGMCALSIDLREIHDVTVQVVSLSGNKMVFMEDLSDADYYQRDYNFMNLPSGIYFMIVSAGKESKVLRFIKI